MSYDHASDNSRRVRQAWAKETVALAVGAIALVSQGVMVVWWAASTDSRLDSIVARQQNLREYQLDTRKRVRESELGIVRIEGSLSNILAALERIEKQRD